MGDHPNAAMFRESFTGDVSEMRDALADDVVWHQIGGNTIHGADAVMEFITAMGDVDINLDLHDVVANDDHTIAMLNVTIGAGGDSFSYRTCEIYHVSDGKVTERWAFSDDTAAISEFFDQFS